MKTCLDCKKEFEATSEFFHSVKGYLQSYCKKCHNIRNQKWKKLNPNSVRKVSLKRVKFTPELYDEMLNSQGNVCALCGTDTPGGRWNRFHADHDHNTDKPRGLLCMSCNHTIGNIELKPADWMDKARKYIDNGGL